MSEIICGDAAECLKALPAGSAKMCVMSPPYYGLRDYGADGQIGIEKSPDEYIARLVAVFDEVWRVLAGDGTLWLNIGDSYAGSGKGPMTISANGKNKDVYDMQSRIYEVPKKWEGIKPKDMIGIPWMLAFALRERGWYLRSDIIWHKTNCLPESVRDRPTKSYEHIFLLAKSSHYYYDYEAIREPLKPISKERYKRGRSADGKYAGQQGISHMRKDFGDFDQEFRRKRDVWEIGTNSYKTEEHFAMFPEKLAEPCILAGSKAGDTVIDPFFGSGTTGAVAKRLGREYIGIDLNAHYLEKARERIDGVIPEKTVQSAEERARGKTEGEVGRFEEKGEAG